MSPHQVLASKEGQCTHRIGGTSCRHHKVTGFASKSQQHSESNTDNPLQSACTGIEAYRCFQGDQGLWPLSGRMRVSLESSARQCSIARTLCYVFSFLVSSSSWWLRRSNSSLLLRYRGVGILRNRSNQGVPASKSRLPGLLVSPSLSHKKIIGLYLQICVVVVMAKVGAGRKSENKHGNCVKLKWWWRCGDGRACR